MRSSSSCSFSSCSLML
uniref:Uncharacterized protein n=1 Tax=Arundo donax TaxID=35708 RepID=A0A0A9BEJ1_ARUDO